ncbi:MAG: tRNA 2-thiouridine(34) synthase MnmA [Bacteroidales bacterium]|jgi:tRNA-specific 2-thiouridylase|nr:tRNA 2-thiouridine(34) synthase MnmA [Bacteroidales bacterium]
MTGKIAVGLSGGVDSSVAAWLLKQQGHDVTGLFMINWHDTEGTLSGDCPWHDDVIFAQLVARKLDIPFETIDLSKEYRQRVVDYMFDEYRRGRTPNPDILCNREIKFDLFAQAAFRRGAQYVATGHYCRRETVTENGVDIHRLLAGNDPGKDQSYFLCQLSQRQLSAALFPVGRMMKHEVRRIAEENGLVTARRKDSQGICFVGKVDLPVFLQQQLKAKEGDIIEIPTTFDGFSRPIPDHPHERLRALATPYTYCPENGRVAGRHAGAHFFTTGQRKGLNVGGMKEPLFVIGTDVERNIIYVGQGGNHPGLYRPALFIAAADIHWVRPDKALTEGNSRRVSVRIRYRQPLQQAALLRMEEGMYILFDEPQRGITPGQFAAWYEGDELTGSGVIR